MDWSGVDYCDVFIRLSFWRHPFTAEHPLLRIVILKPLHSHLCRAVRSKHTNVWKHYCTVCLVLFPLPHTRTNLSKNRFVQKRYSSILFVSTRTEASGTNDTISIKLLYKPSLRLNLIHHLKWDALHTIRFQTHRSDGKYISSARAFDYRIKCQNGFRDPVSARSISSVSLRQQRFNERVSAESQVTGT